MAAASDPSEAVALGTILAAIHTVANQKAILDMAEANDSRSQLVAFPIVAGWAAQGRFPPEDCLRVAALLTKNPHLAGDDRASALHATIGVNASPLHQLIAEDDRASALHATIRTALRDAGSAADAVDFLALQNSEVCNLMRPEIERIIESGDLPLYCRAKLVLLLPKVGVGSHSMYALKATTTENLLHPKVVVIDSEATRGSFKATVAIPHLVLKENDKYTVAFETDWPSALCYRMLVEEPASLAELERQYYGNLSSSERNRHELRPYLEYALALLIATGRAGARPGQIDALDEYDRSGILTKSQEITGAAIEEINTLNIEIGSRRRQGVTHDLIEPSLPLRDEAPEAKSGAG